MPAHQPKPAKTSPAPALPTRTLVIDIGGTGIKAIILDARGEPMTERVRVATPRPATPGRVLAEIAKRSHRWAPSTASRWGSRRGGRGCDQDGARSSTKPGPASAWPRSFSRRPRNRFAC